MNRPFIFERQFIAMLLGLAGIVVVMQFDYHVFRYFSVPFLGLTLVGLAIVLFFGEAILGAQRGFMKALTSRPRWRSWPSFCISPIGCLPKGTASRILLTACCLFR
ncbi:MAG: FtsW/RodA/SpoVE family cell cycle protein [Chloroflexi bacterium]|nr:FtsW/RodA/SpoVE family cell cycle protein [Chloroflexota bacterium]